MKEVLKKLLLSLCLLSSLALAYRPGDKVVLTTLPGCEACEQAKQILYSHHIKFSTKQESWGYAPKLYVNGKYMGTGVGAVETYANS